MTPELLEAGAKARAEYEQRRAASSAGGLMRLREPDFRHGVALYLDDVTVSELAEKLQIPLIPVNGINDFLEKLGENRVSSIE